MSYTEVADALNPIAAWLCEDSSGDLTDDVGSLDIPLYISGQVYGEASLVPSLAGSSTSVQVGSGGNGWYYSGAMAGIEADDVFGMNLWINHVADFPVVPACIWWKSEATSTANYYVIQAVRVTASTAKLAVYWGLQSGSVVMSCLSDAACLTKGAAHHIAISRSNSLGILIWVDGQRVASTMGTAAPDVNGTPTTVSTSLTRVTVGMGYTAQNKAPFLRVHQIRVFPKPLTTPEVQAMHNAGVGTSAPTYSSVVDPENITPAVTRLRANADPVAYLVCGNSNANWINDPSNDNSNYGRIGGVYHGFRNLGYPWRGTTPLMPGFTPDSVASEVAHQSNSLPWDVTVINSYGANTGAPAGADIFWDKDQEGTTGSNYIAPFRYRYDLADGSSGASTAWLSNGRVWPGAVTIRSTAPIAGDNLQATYWYVEGPYTGDAPGQINPTARQTSDVKVGSEVDLTAGSYAVASATLNLDSDEYNGSANVIFNWGANGSSTVRGSLVTLALQVESRDVPGGFYVGPLCHGGGKDPKWAADALANLADEAFAWYWPALCNSMSTPMCVVEWTWAINSESAMSHQDFITHTVNALTRLRNTWTAAGYDSDNLIFILANDQPVGGAGVGTSTAVEEAYVIEAYFDMLEAAESLGNCVVVGRHLVNDYDAYIANGWDYAEDNHHLTVPDGYNGEAVAVFAAMGVPQFPARSHSTLGFGMGLGIGIGF